ncbi:FixH family protein [Pigmentiphaga soli]|uniref:FixH family protein n=1 Tax=Pigmentiphaga soli TaxID=1007095 RepID=A0ABP8HFL0_9BURK
MNQVQATNPWWREPWPWLLMAGPAVAMAGCVVTIYLAVTHDDPPIVHEVSRRGLVVDKVAAPRPAEVRGRVGP